MEKPIDNEGEPSEGGMEAGAAAAAAAAAASAKPDQLPLTVGIIGGLGPYATVQFEQLVIDKTVAFLKELNGDDCTITDQQHIPSVTVSNPAIVDRQEAILRGVEKEKCGVQLRDAAARVRKAGADLAVCVCNSAHFFQKHMQAGLEELPFVSIIELTAATISETTRQTEMQSPGGHGEAGKPIVGILAASGCAASGMYQRALSAKGIPFETPDDETQAKLMKAIYETKGGKIGKGREVLDDVLNGMMEAGVKIFILGCTELPLIMSHPSPMGVLESETAGVAKVNDTEESADAGLSGVVFFNPNAILADTVVRVCKGAVSLEAVRSEMYR